MIKKILKWFVIPVIVLLIALIAIVGISSSMSLDRNYLHTKSVDALPMLSDETTAGIVRIEANGFEFRSRIAGNVPGAPTVILLHGFSCDIRDVGADYSVVGGRWLSCDCL